MTSFAELAAKIAKYPTVISVSGRYGKLGREEPRAERDRQCRAAVVRDVRAGRDRGREQLARMASHLEEAVRVMDRLRSPGGCPWDAEQTHASLARYLLEETYEVLEAIETADRRCCARSSATCCCRCSSTPGWPRSEPDPYSIEDVAADLVAKLIRRHPHVFARTARRPTPPS